LECSDCFSYGNENDDQSSYDSEYDYPRECNWEIECREREEAAQAEAAEQQRWEENTRNSDGETWDEEAIADEAEHRREVAQMKHDGDHPDVQQLEDIDIEVMEPKERFTASSAAGGGMLSAQKKAAAGAAAKAAKARITKQEQKKQQRKFVPVQVSINTNHGNEVTATLTANKLEINLSKKNLQGASREAVKRHNQKWNRVNALAKQSGARGTKIATLPDPRPWYNNSTCYGYESD
jgi:hypothetical protein